MHVIETLADWSLRPGSLHARLEGAFRDAIERGLLPGGTRLPAERSLARMLSVSRSTVAAAYAALGRDQLIEGRRGSGTYVCLRGPARMRPPAALPTRTPRAIALGALAAPEHVIELTTSTAPLDGVFTAEQIGAAFASAPLQEGNGYFPLGTPELRRAIAAHFGKHGLPTDEEQIVVTTGAQQAIGLVGALLARRGDHVALESATFPGAIDALSATGATLVGVPLDERGTRVDLLREAASREPIRLAYVIPTFHNPTGALMPESRRRDLARLAAELDLPVIDDCTFVDLWLHEPPPPPIAAFAPGAPVFTVGSASKLFWGGLRIGWVRAPEAFLAPLARLKAVADLGSSVVSQALAAALLPRALEFRELRRRQVADSQANLAGLLGDLLPEWTWMPPAGGLSLWVRLPRGDAEEFAQLALRHGVLVLPGGTTSPTGQHRDHVRLPLLREPGVMVEAVNRLARAWEAYEPALERSRATALSVVV